MAKKRTTVLDELSRVRFIGPKMAELLYDEHDIRTIADIVEFGEEDQLTELKGVGKKKASTILSSARRIASSNGKDEEPSEDAEQEQKTEKKEEKQEEPQEEEAATESGNGGAGPRQQTQANGRDRSQPSERRKPTPSPTPGGARAGAATSASTPEPSSAQRVDADVETKPDTRPLRDRFVETLRCPACGNDSFDVGSTTLTCQACQRQFNFQNGIADLAPPATEDRSLTQKVMESRVYTQVYEEFFRPKLTSIVSKRSMRDEYRLAADFLDFDNDVRLLDVGCGTANFTRYLAQRIGLAETPATAPDLPLVVGMDLSWPMLENARRNIRQENLDGKVFLLRGDATRIPLRRGAYTRLHCAGTLHLLNDIDEGLRNFARVLEPNGICVIGTFVLGKGIMRRMLKRAAEFPTRFHWFSRDELHRRIERAGFEIVDDSLAGDAITVKARRI